MSASDGTNVVKVHVYTMYSASVLTRSGICTCVCGSTCTVEFYNHAPLLCMIALGKTGEGAYAQDSDIYM